MGGILLDTCAIIWLMNGEILKPIAIKEIENAQNESNLYVSPISTWEIAHLVAKNKITLTMPTQEWFQHLINIDGVKIAELTPKILMSSVELGDGLHSDPADRIIIASARSLNLTLVSRDGLIKKYAAQGFLKFLEC